MLSAVGRNLGNKLQNIYANRRSYAQSAQKLVGGGRKIISALGRANEFASRIGISNPKYLEQWAQSRSMATPLLILLIVNYSVLANRSLFYFIYFYYYRDG